MKDIPEGYTYMRCDQYTENEFIAMFTNRSVKKVVKQYVKDNPKEFYNTDDEIAIHQIFNDASVTSLRTTYSRPYTKRYKFPESN